MTTDAGRAHRLTELLRAEGDRLVARWPPVADRDGSALEQSEYAEVKALLVNLSRTRARQGLAPSETASSIFAP